MLTSQGKQLTQYAHRISSIFRESSPGRRGLIFFAAQISPLFKKRVLTSGRGTVITLALSEQVSAGGRGYRPHVARYLVELARDFNKFYHNCPVLGTDEDLRKVRLMLIKGVQIVLRNGLELLGIEAPEEM